MFSPLRRDANVMMAPRVPILLFEKAVEQHGYAAALTGRFKKHREGWITAVWALALRELTGLQYWIEFVIGEQTPDCRVHFIDQIKGYHQRNTIHVEVAEWEQHNQRFLDVLSAKCQKAYPAYYFLVILARNGNMIDVPAVTAYLQNAKTTFGEIWVLGRESDENAVYTAVMLHPIVKQVVFDLHHSLRNDVREKEILIQQKRGKSTELEDLGLVYFELPHRAG